MDHLMDNWPGPNSIRPAASIRPQQRRMTPLLGREATHQPAPASYSAARGDMTSSTRARCSVPQTHSGRSACTSVIPKGVMV